MKQTGFLWCIFIQDGGWIAVQLEVWLQVLNLGKIPLELLPHVCMRSNGLSNCSWCPYKKRREILTFMAPLTSFKNGATTALQFWQRSPFSQIQHKKMLTGNKPTWFRSQYRSTWKQTTPHTLIFEQNSVGDIRSMTLLNILSSDATDIIYSSIQFLLEGCYNI